MRARHDVVRVDHLRGPVLFRIRPGTGQARPLLERGPSIVLREVEHDAVRGRASPRCWTYIFIKYG